MENQSTVAGANVRLRLCCPRCGVSGWIDWRNLHHSLHCSRCDCQFLLGSHGKLLSQADMPQVQFACPRCGQTGSLPAALCARGAECAACRLPLALGPDHRLHGAKEAAALHRSTHTPEHPSCLVIAMGRLFFTTDGRPRAVHIGAGVGLVVTALVAAAWALSAIFGDSADAAARRFTQACLADKADAAERFLQDDPVQRAEFERWWVRHFPSIQDAHRPSGDKVELNAATQSELPSSCTLRVTLRSSFLGERSHDQVWSLAGDRWWFDAHQTLMAEDRAVFASPP